MTLEATTSQHVRSSPPREAPARHAQRPNRVVLAIAIVALLGMIAAIVMTRWGTGLSTDSMTYLRAAEMFENGYGIVQPGPAGEIASPHFPPLYPLAISALTFGDVPPRVTARWLNVALLVVNVVLIALVAQRATGHTAATIVAAALFAAANTLIELHIWAWSEPLFLALMMSSLLLLTSGLARSSWRLLLLAALATAAAALTRYAGVAVIGARALGVLLLGPWTFRRRLVTS